MLRKLKKFFKPVLSSGITIKEILDETSSQIYSDLEDVSSFVIFDVQTLKNATKKDITFFYNTKYKEELQNTKAGACFLKEEHIKFLPKGVIGIVNSNPYLAYAQVFNILYHSTNSEYIEDQTTEIDKSAKIENTAQIGCGVKIGKDVYIGHNTIIGYGVEIGNNTIINDNVTIKYSVIKNDCYIESGARIGTVGFGYAPGGANGSIPIPHIGSVLLENNVFIGANTSIDRAVFGSTSIGQNTKIDNLVQIAHNVKVGKNVFIAAQVGIAGSSVIDDFCSLGGAAGIAPHLYIAKKTTIAPRSGVGFNIEKENTTVMGYPAVSFSQFWKMHATIKKLVNNNKGKGKNE